MYKTLLRFWAVLLLAVLSCGRAQVLGSVPQHIFWDKYTSVSISIDCVVSERSSTYGVDERSPNRQTEGDSVGGRKALRVERVERIGGFDREKLERSFGLVRFRSSAQARYALDLGNESWYLGSVKMDSFYKEFARGYIAPWKLIPLGERDVVEAYHDDSKDIDLSRVRFASAPDSPALPAAYDEVRKAWTLTLPATESNSTYEVFALYQGKVIGKLCVVSYPKQSYKLRLVPVNDQSFGDVSRLSQQLNSIYNKHGVSFTLYEGEGVSSELKAKILLAKTFGNYRTTTKPSTASRATRSASLFSAQN